MMNNLIKWMTGVVVVMLLLVLPASKAQAQDDYVSYQTFYDDLSPYGQWVNDPQYGNVWVPDAGNDFRPYYTNGYWAMTDYGNTWVSNYQWGWAPFHYGRWTYNPFYGWVWIPGNTWGPAWVSWRSGGGNYGWAPMGPGISVGISVGNYSCPNDWWVFVGPQYLYSNNFHRHWRGARYNSTYINQTTIINHTYNNTYVYGPRANEIERVTHQRVNTHRIARGERGRTVVRDNTVNIYRPSVRGTATEGQPRNVVRAPREIGQPQGGVRTTRTEFKTMATRGELKPVSTGGRDNTVRENNGTREQGGREQRFDNRDTRTNQVRPVEANDRGRTDQRIERPQPQRIERPQPERQQPQRIERQQPQRIERPAPQRQQPQRVERQQPQRIERPAPQRQQPQRVERQQPQRIERPAPQRQQPQRVERPAQQSRPQAAPRPQPQRQSPAPSNTRSNSNERSRTNKR